MKESIFSIVTYRKLASLGKNESLRMLFFQDFPKNISKIHNLLEIGKIICCSIVYVFNSFTVLTNVFWKTLSKKRPNCEENVV